MVKLAFVLTAPRQIYPIYESKTPLQVASLPPRNHLAVRPMVLALSAQLSKLGRNDVGEGSDGGPYDGVSMGALLMPLNWINDAECI